MSNAHEKLDQLGALAARAQLLFDKAIPLLEPWPAEELNQLDGEEFQQLLGWLCDLRAAREAWLEPTGDEANEEIHLYEGEW